MLRSLIRFPSTTCALVALAVVGAAPAPDARTEAVVACWEEAPTDLDGGGPDIALGYPSYDLPGARDAGAIVLHSDLAPPGSSTPHAPGRRIVLTAESFGLPVQAGARFGAAVVTVPDDALHVDDDDCADLLVGAPGAVVEGVAGAGQVHLLAGGEGAMASAPVESYDGAALPGIGGPQAEAGFGTALALSGGVVAIGEPRRDVNGVIDAGRVVRVDGQGAEPEPVVTAFTQGGGSEPGDRFGEVLDAFPTGLGALILVGIPHEDVGSRADAGAVALIAPDDVVNLVTQNSAGAAGTAESGDRFGASIDAFATFTSHPVVRVAIGAPGEDVGSLRDAGLVGWAVVDLFDSPRGVSLLRGTGVTLTQRSPGVAGSAEAGDRFGEAVVTGEYGTDGGRRHLVVGAPTEDVGAVADSGAVARTRVTEEGAAMAGPSDGWTQDETGTAGAAERGDRLGAALASVDLTRIIDDDHVTWQVVLATVPREDVGSVADVGVAYLGVPGSTPVLLLPPFAQTGAGVGMTPMHGW